MDLDIVIILIYVLIERFELVVIVECHTGTSELFQEEFVLHIKYTIISDRQATYLLFKVLGPEIRFITPRTIVSLRGPWIPEFCQSFVSASVTILKFNNVQ